ncbi:MBOAT family O-acyltransferase [Acidisoma sp.]|uniref:MBOAT family O-acyltransferase n=1 Tax=Acidisoma sp. TaxID=1872115 RepID=UPI003B00585F
MLFGTPLFLLIFLPLTLAGFHFIGRWLGRGPALVLLIGASLVFYGWGRPDDLPLLVGSIIANYALGRRATRPGWFAGGIVANLALLGVFKYGAFIARVMDWPDPHLSLPLGISFFTFQQIMYLAECRRGGRLPSFLGYASCIAFFGHLIAGPLVRPSEIIPQFEHSTAQGFRPDEVGEGLMIVLLGLAKKLVLADGFAPLADRGFDAAAHGGTLTLLEAWFAALAFSLQIYFDFSGYSDIAIGLARMFNIRFPLNFNSPYKALTIQDFWRRWNMTLSRFLRDFLYVPLGGNRHGEPRRLLNLMLTMLLGGLWHGAAWRFLLWGGLHGLYLVIHQEWERRTPAWLRLPPVLAHGLTLLAVVIAWVPFRAANLAATTAMLRGMAGLNGLAIPAPLVALAPWLGHIARVVPVLPALGDARTLSLPDATACLMVGWFIVLCLPHLHEASPRLRACGLLGSGGFTVQALFFAGVAAPFLYFRF